MSQEIGPFAVLLAAANCALNSDRQALPATMGLDCGDKGRSPRRSFAGVGRPSRQ